MSEFKKTIKEFKEEGGFWWMAGFMLLVLGAAFAELSTPTWWPSSFLASPTVCFVWFGAIVLTYDKVRSLNNEIEEINDHIYRNNGEEVLMIKTDVYTENDTISVDDVRTESSLYWAKAES